MRRVVGLFAISLAIGAFVFLALFFCITLVMPQFRYYWHESNQLISFAELLFSIFVIGGLLCVYKDYIALASEERRRQR
jgi:hypothetical protein